MIELCSVSKPCSAHQVIERFQIVFELAERWFVPAGLWPLDSGANDVSPH